MNLFNDEIEFVSKVANIENKILLFVKWLYLTSFVTQKCNLHKD
jgi:hypothetical protein